MLVAAAQEALLAARLLVVVVAAVFLAAVFVAAVFAGGRLRRGRLRRWSLVARRGLLRGGRPRGGASSSPAAVVVFAARGRAPRSSSRRWSSRRRSSPRWSSPRSSSPRSSSSAAVAGRRAARPARRGRLLLGVLDHLDRGRPGAAVAAARAGPLDALAQGGHQVDDLRVAVVGGRQRGRADVAALGLGLDELAQRRGPAVLVLVGVEVRGHRLHERGRHLQLLRADVDLLGEDVELRGADLVRPQHGLQDDDVVADPQHGHALAPAQGHGDHGHPVGLLQRPAQQRVGLGRLGLGLQVVRLVEHDRVDLLGRDELVDLDLVAGRGGQGVQVLVVEDDHLAVGRWCARGRSPPAAPPRRRRCTPCGSGSGRRPRGAPC